MVYDPGWSKLAATGSQFPSQAQRVPFQPIQRWATLTPKVIGSDVDFMLEVRAQYAAFQVRDTDPVRIDDIPLVTP